MPPSALFPEVSRELSCKIQVETYIHRLNPANFECHRQHNANRQTLIYPDELQEDLEFRPNLQTSKHHDRYSFLASSSQEWKEKLLQYRDTSPVLFLQIFCAL